MTSSRAVLSVDLEFLTHTPAYRAARGSVDGPVGLTGLQSLLDLLAEADAQATFFTVSEIADDFPELLGEIAARGHEIASHTHTHRFLSDLTPAQRRAEILRSKDRLASVSGAEVRGFRAPSFDIPENTFETLVDAGYMYDSSTVPCRRIPGWYGGEFSEVEPWIAAKYAHSSLVELPVAVMPRLRLPLSGTWLRFFGVYYTIRGMRSLAARDVSPILYVHPWELEQLPAVDGLPARLYWRTGSYLRRAVRSILDQPFDFVTAATLAEESRCQTIPTDSSN